MTSTAMHSGAVLCLKQRPSIATQHSTIRHLKQREIRPYLHRKPKENRKEEPNGEKNVNEN